MPPHIPPLQISWLGQLPYADGWHRQQETVQAIAAGTAPEQIWLLEHPPTYTLGRRADPAHLLLDQPALEAAGFALHHVDRGGDITYHGPGQLVGYPLLRLAGRQGLPTADLTRYLRDLEQVVIDLLAQLGVRGWRMPGYTGVWVDQPEAETGNSAPHKIAAIGVKVSGSGITSHGFALNVSTELSHFDHIIPCGIREYRVTSLNRLSGSDHTPAGLVPLCREILAQRFGNRPNLHP
jgi:lipoyl(octanoyl) transferase